MEWNQIEGQWGIIKGQAKQKWAKLTDDDLLQIKGQKETLIGRLQQYYGYAKEQLEIQLKEFQTSLTKSHLTVVPDEKPDIKIETAVDDKK